MKMIKLINPKTDLSELQQNLATTQVMPKLWAIIPAAGTGSRFSKTELKQYQYIHQKTVLEHTVNAIYQLPLAGCVIALHAEDKFAQQLPLPASVQFCRGGQERMDSVLVALDHLQNDAQPDDYVLVHDAARPCLHLEQINLLLKFANTDQNAAIIATPVRDTLKKAALNQPMIAHTVDRENLWQAQTPQMVKYQLLREALLYVKAHHLLVTDEASALEHLQVDVTLLQGRSDNIKITYPDDLALAALILAAKH